MRHFISLEVRYDEVVIHSADFVQLHSMWMVDVVSHRSWRDDGIVRSKPLSRSRQADFSLPHGIVDAKFFNEMLPSRSTSFLPPQVCKKLLPPMY
jgi:hypothetical protein